MKRDIINEKGSLKDCTDFSSLKDYLGKNYNIEITSAVEKLDFALVKRTLSGFESVSGEFHELVDNVTKIKSQKTGVMCCDGENIFFNADYFTDYDTLIRSCKRNSGGYWIKNASPESIMVHESAHAVEDLLIKLNKSYTNHLQRTQAWNHCIEAEKIVREASKELQESTWGKDFIKQFLDEGYEQDDWNMYLAAEKDENIQYGFKGLFVTDISEYAGTSYSECMAEAFADVYANGENASPFSKKIKEITIKTYHDYKKKGGML